MASSIDSQIGSLRTNYNNSNAAKNSSKWGNATIQDLSKKYGFNYSQQYANQQAKVEADAQRNAYKASQRTNQSNYNQSMQTINDGLRQGITGTERDYFQKGLQNQQAQADRGINAGLLADSNLRLSMNQQDVMADYYRDAGRARSTEQDRFNNESLRLQEALKLVDSSEKAKASALYQQFLQQGYENLTSERGFWSQENELEYGRYRDEVNRLEQLREFNEGVRQSNRDFSENVRQYNQDFNEGSRQFNVDFAEGIRQFNADLAERKRQFNSEADWRKHEFNNMSASQKAELKQNASQFGEEMAWKNYELSEQREFEKSYYESQSAMYNGGGSSMDFLP